MKDSKTKVNLCIFISGSHFFHKDRSPKNAVLDITLYTILYKRCKGFLGWLKFINDIVKTKVFSPVKVGKKFS